MWRLLVRQHHLRVTHDTVRLMLRQMDPVGVAERQHHRLRRRTYSSQGPNDTWHVDGYDKLGPYGIFINGYVAAIISLRKMFFRVQHHHSNSCCIFLNAQCKSAALKSYTSTGTV